jgi:radical SAM protein with 4Fe4S-binding SPASM domain
MMSPEEFKVALEQLAPRTSLLHFHVLGEPLLHPDIGLFLDMCEKSGTQVHIVSNGTLLHKRIDDLRNKDALRSISISLQSMCATATEEEFCNYLDVLIGSIQTFSSSKPLFSLRLWNQGTTTTESISFEKALKEMGNRFKRKDLLDSLLTQRAMMLSENLSINTAERFEWPQLNTTAVGDTGYCLGLKEQIVVLADGTVVPCCLDSDGVMSLGNIFTTPLEMILLSDRAKNIQFSFRKNIVAEELCKHCTFRTRFS